MIVITGATGQLGRLVISSLLARTAAANIAVAVRSVDKAADLAALGVQVRQADYDDAASLDAAFRGASKILLISSNDIGRRAQQHQNVIDAARRTGVALLAYTSVLRADTSVLGLAGEHRATEAAIRASGLPFTLLRNGWYLENYSEHLQAVLAHGVVMGCAKDGRVAAAARADYAAAAAAVLLSAEAPAQVYELAGEQAFTMTELAAEVARQSGRAVSYQDMAQQEYKAALIGVGVPEGFADLLADSDAGLAQGALDGSGAVLRALIGRPTTTLAQAVQVALGK
ncbi:SDR family oxidoreductase [Janthinobacterium sp.]|uniref:SDR family oxidoreductase n=1 Tax=Janthinobacterium sp. TaxID=1871054 RepID=UPI00293D8D2F|nr:SDR family oxidoreductase [Janthinobacterium sp.]